MPWRVRRLTVSILGVVGLCAALAGSAVRFNLASSATYDEVAHLPAGVSYLKTADFRLNTEHPPLAKLLAAAVVLAIGPEVWDARTIESHELFVEASGPRTRGAQWGFGFDMLYGSADPDRVLFLGRLAITAVALALGLLVYAWATELYGTAGGLVALGLYALCPSIAAHGSLVTTDLLAAALSFLSVYLAWRWARRSGNAGVLVAAAFVAGLAVATRATALVIPLLLTGPWLHDLYEGRRARVDAWLVVVMPLAALAGVWAVYGFDGRTETPLHWDVMLAISSAPLRLFAEVARATGILPDPFVFGILNLAGSNAQVQTQYLLGEWSSQGFWSYMAVAAAVKLPVGTSVAFLIAGALGFVQVIRRGDEVWLVAPAATAVAFVVLFAHHDVGFRHVLPALPFLFVFSGRLAVLATGPARRAGVALLVMATGLEAGWASPHSLGFASAAVGGPANAHRLVVDSDLDWGQDLPGLRRAMESRSIERVKLAYFGSASVAHHGIAFDPLPGRGIGGSHFVDGEAPLVGALAVSATVLHSPFRKRPAYAEFLAWLAEQPPVATIGGSILLFEFPPNATWPNPNGRTRFIPLR